MRDSRLATVVWVLTFLIGVGYLCLLPPFEGFDETAHYARIREIADLGRATRYGDSWMDRRVLAYPGPMPYGSLAPPFDAGLTYHGFFQDASQVDRFRQFAVAQTQPPFVASEVPNWQAQHPPLYYVLLAPLEKATRSRSLMTQLLVLRLVSFAIAWAGFAFALRAALVARSDATASVSAMLGCVLYPLMLPMVVAEFARIGNDSLCLLLTGLVSWLLVLQERSPRSRGLPIAIGIVLSCGLLTKAFFVAIVASLMLFFAFARVRSGAARRRPDAGRLAAMFVLPILVGGAWYGSNLVAYGDVVGGNDAIRLAGAGGYAANLAEHFSLRAMGRAVASTVGTFLWGGSWSLVHMPLPMLAAMAVLPALATAAFLCHVVSLPLSDLRWLPVWLLLTFGFGLVHHMVIGIALNGNGTTPGWYLHILLPWVAPALGSGLVALRSVRWLRPVLVGLLVHAGVFAVAAVWFQAALFAGCATKGDDKAYAFPTGDFCLQDLSGVREHLAVIGWPAVTMACFAGALFCGAWMAVAARRQRVSTGASDR